MKQALTDLANIFNSAQNEALEKRHDSADLIISKLRNIKGRYVWKQSAIDITKEEDNVLSFFLSWQGFNNKGIPFELWSDICEEGLELLKKLLEDPSIPYKELEGYKEFINKSVERGNQLRNLGDPDIEYVMNEMECRLTKEFSKEQLEEWSRRLKQSP